MGRTNRMKAVLMVAATWMLSCAVMQAAEREFTDVVRAISDQFHARPAHIPLFGLVNFATFVAHPAGVKHIDFALFENLDLSDYAARDIAETIRRANPDWLPFVRVQEHGETVFVYMAQDRSDCKLLVVTVETGEATVVEVTLNSEAVQAWLRQPEASAARNVSR
jgi:hypothetical protein